MVGRQWSAEGCCVLRRSLWAPLAAAPQSMPLMHEQVHTQTLPCNILYRVIDGRVRERTKGCTASRRYSALERATSVA
jgi:hypothetical protein